MLLKKKEKIKMTISGTKISLANKLAYDKLSEREKNCHALAFFLAVLKKETKCTA
jgi:hypothetical protein